MRLPIALRSIEPLVKGPLLDLFGLNVSSCFLPPSHKSGATGSRIPFLILVATAEDDEEGRGYESCCYKNPKVLQGKAVAKCSI